MRRKVAGASLHSEEQSVLTINIAVTVAEGLVMAADSFSQMSTDGGGVRATHSSVEKITEIGDRQIAVMIHGLGSISNRTILSLVREFEFTEYGKDPAPIRTWTVVEFSENLTQFIGDRYAGEYPAPAVGEADNRPTLGLVVGGYSPGKFFPEVVTIEFPEGIHARKWPDDPNDEPFGGWYVDMWGIRKSLNRLLFGFDLDSLMAGYRFLVEMKAKKDAGETAYDSIPEPPPIAPDQALRPMSALETISHRLDGLPLQEAVEFADWLGTVAIGYDRFTEGPPSVGGDLDVLAIQAEGLTWYRRKPFAAKMAEARDRGNLRGR